jgi:hypothetical protein
MSKRLVIIIFFLSILLIEFWSISVTYNYAYRQGRKDGIGEMVTTIDSIFVNQKKLKEVE